MSRASNRILRNRQPGPTNPSRPSKFLGAGLYLDFIRSSRPDPRITFTRSSNATMTGPDGKLQYAPHNLLAYSEQLDNAAWGKTNASVAANSTIAPDGTKTADKLIEDTTNGQHSINTFGATVGTLYNISFWAKAAERTQIIITGFGLSGQGYSPLFDLTNGVVSGAPAGASITNSGNGWYRCILPVTASGTAGLFIYSALNGSNTFQGDGTSGVYIWGVQINVGGLQPYYPTTSAAYYGPRFDYDPVTLQPKGLLIEEQRTNLAKYSSEISQGLHLEWQFNATSTPWLPTATTVAPDGTQNGQLYTVVAGGTAHTAYQVMTVTASTTYTWSCYFKLGTLPISDFKIAFRDDTAGVFIAQDITPTYVSVGGGWSRLAYSLTTPAGCVSLRCYPIRTIGPVTGGTISFWGAQLEAGAFPASYIPTTTAAATRAADIATITGSNFSSWYRQDEGTLVAEADTIRTTGSSPIFIVQIAGGNDRHQLGVLTNTGATVNAGVVQANIGVNTAQSAKLAYAYKVNDFAAVTNGGVVSTDASGTVPSSLTYATLGKFDFGGGESLNGHLRRITYYPRRLTDAELQALTA